MRKNILIFIPTASLLMMMFSPRLTNAKTQELNTKARKTHPKQKKKHQPQRPGMGVCQQRNPNAKESAQNNH
jgi:hypothetical protein